MKSRCIPPRTRARAAHRALPPARLLMITALLLMVTAAMATPLDTVRFASFNASLNRNSAGGLIADLSTPANAQAQAVAEVIQRVNPDILLINEFDFDANGEAASLFQSNYLGVSQNGIAPVFYDHVYVAPSNTGVPSGFDLDNSGAAGDFAPNDAQGFGFFEGQFAFAIFSKYDIDEANIRSFQEFLWKDMPGALLPEDPLDVDGNGDLSSWYTPAELDVLRLSSKNHVDVPIIIDGETVHVLAAHPTPPVFDGPEDRNGTRNHEVNIEDTRLSLSCEFSFRLCSDGYHLKLREDERRWCAGQEAQEGGDSE